LDAAILIPFLLIIGLAVGSFLNVCIYRIPIGKSIIRPGSFCPLCKKPITWYDNIPIISYVLLGGRCRWCKEAISLRYPIVESLTGALFILFFYCLVIKTGEPLEVYVIYTLLGCALIVSSFIDVELYIIPNEITYAGMVSAPLFSLLFPSLHHSTGNLRVFNLLGSVRLDALAASLLGILIGGGLVLVFGVLGTLLLRKEAMGMGDVKLMAMVGGIMGWKPAVVIFFLAPFFALAVAIPLLFLGKGRTIPYAPFLSMATLVSIPYHEPFVRFLDSRLYLFSELFRGLL
jgi:leader peptidase (prepilin peptidase)/N-methyltransferase